VQHLQKQGVDSNSGNIFNSFARGEVFSTSTDVGGFIGDSSSTRINYSYSTGLVHGTAQVGGFIGDGTAGDKIENSFWDNQTSNQTVSEGGQGKLTAEMQNAENFTDIDKV
jgi:hypothetical protein